MSSRSRICVFSIPRESWMLFPLTVNEMTEQLLRGRRHDAGELKKRRWEKLKIQTPFFPVMADSWFMMKNDFSFDHAPFSSGQRRKNKPQQTLTPVLSIRWIPVLVTVFTSSISGLLFLSQCGVSTVVTALPGDSGGGKRRLERLIRPFASQREIQTE